MKTILEYLELDAQNRHKDGKLLKRSYAKVKSNEHYNFGAIETLDSFSKLNYKGYVIAGGFFSHTDKSDIDIFIYKDHEKILERVISQFTHGLPKDECYFYRTRYTIDIYIKDGRVGESTKIQIVLRKYVSIAEILYGFDIGPSQVAWDGKRLYFTTMSNLAYKTGFMILDTTRRSLTFEKRIQKYVDKGFCPIFPFYKSVNLKGVTSFPNKYFLYEKNSFYPLVNDRGAEYCFGSKKYADNTELNCRYLLGKSQCFCIRGLEMRDRDFNRLE